MVKYSDIVYKFQRVQIMILHMDEPTISNFDAWFSKLIDMGEEEAVAHMEKSINSVADGTKTELKGWDDLYAAYCVMHGAFLISNYRDVVEEALKVEKNFNPNENRGVVIGFKNTLEQIEDKYQVRAVQKFFDAIKDKDPKLAIRMKRCLEYPRRVSPKVQTKEEKQQLEALELVREEVEDEDF